MKKLEIDIPLLQLRLKEFGIPENATAIVVFFAW
jgi:hypothetical protein